MIEYEIFACSAAEGLIGLSPLPGRFGTYARDWQIIQRWPADMVLSMTTQAEMEAHGAASLAMDCAAHDILWRHLPVKDFGAPGPDVINLWPEVSAQAAGILRLGGQVLIHCHGGCGRSGMAAVRLMADLGEPPEAALQRLRDVRPCAIETTAQHAWATQT